ncbi:MAG: transglutaminase-like domain-containing protein [Sulfuricurvum sp.]|uniref:transglutaminase-like domain-containing protein n=1 Tax=Sulfuricurvum sp. TaxID=2025608 RepID=UPI00261DEF15|nr:transglutaminase-like domain-containing protein [Sulfuricurvum sp.]MDD2369158.1 transglutaminase-like domain-containing protein [Sulfuricurvum sp.]MDD5119585.1 transglutaminase-like domain-containing protein [Sulfuricurvum sp.]
MENLGIKILVLMLLGVILYREIIRSAALHSAQPASIKSKASFINLLIVGSVVTLFVYAGMQITFIETRDLRPYLPKHLNEVVTPFDKGIIELNGMVIKTNLAKKGELLSLATRLTQGCNGDDGCEAQKLFDYVTHIPYKTDYTSRNALDVVRSNWGDCDDKSNLFASLLNEKGIDYRFVYVRHHVFVVVHVNDTSEIPFLNARLRINGKDYYYAETTATGARIGEFNGQFPFSFEGIYDIKNNEAVDKKDVSFRMG